MRKAVLTVLSILILFSAVFLYFRFNSFKEVEIKGNKFKAELAVLPSEREKGLSDRKSFCEECAMLFIFEKPGRYSFWMKDMRFSLDIIWILDHKVVYIANNVSPDFRGGIQSSILADKVLEINGGIAEKYGLGVGDEVKF